MASSGKIYRNFDELRKMAEGLIKEHEVDDSLSRMNMIELIEELRIHQAELEIQNQELRDAQEEISRLHREYEDLYEFAPSGYLVVGTKGNIVRCNLTGSTFLSAQRSLLSKLNFSNFLAPESQDIYFAALKQTEKDETVKSRELKLRRGDGSFLWVRADIQAEFTLDGRAGGWRLTLVDINEQKKAEAELVLREEKYHALMEQSLDMIYLHDLEGNLLEANHAAVARTGYSREELLGMNVFDLLTHQSGRREILRQWKEWPHGEPTILELVHADKEGREFPVEMKTGKICFGNREYILALARDITERKQAEKQLIQANQELQKANTEKDKLFSFVAHDLKGPIAGFLNLTERLSKDINSFSLQELEPLAREMHKSSESLYALLEDLLQWSLMRQGMLDYSPESACLNDLVTASFSIAKPLACQKDIALWNNVPKDIAVFADQKMIHTVIRNVFFNAVKFTNRGGNISIHAHEAGSMVKVMVQDDGIGMNKETTLNVFAIDQRISLKGTEGEKGTGLGLALCKDLVEMHGGQIWIESEPGQGTTVYFTVPGGGEAVCSGQQI